MGRPAHLLWAALLLGACTTEKPEAPGLERVSQKTPFHNVVLIVIDTLRADVLASAHTPNLDAIATAGTQVDKAWSSGTWTVPSMVSMFTGAPVRAHGWDLPSGRIGSYPRLPAMPTLAEVLGANGMQTTALVTNPYLTKDLGFDRGFERYIRTSDAAILRTLNKAYLKHRDPQRRQFLYLHLLGPHSPLAPSEAAAARHGLTPEDLAEPKGLQIGAAKRNRLPGIRDAYRRAYHAVVEDTDARVGALLEALSVLGTDTLVIVTSDHGEMLGEHNVVGHGRHLWEPLTHVPLLIKDVRGLPEKLGIDAIPALTTELLGIEAQWPTGVFDAGPLVSQREGALALSQDGTIKWVWNSKGANRFDLAQDPGEDTPSSMDQPGSEARAAWETRVIAGPELPLVVTLPEKTQEELKVLGYAD